MRSLLIIFLLVSFCSFSQKKRKNTATENYFGITYKPLIPFGLVGDKPVDIKVESFTTNVRPTFGYTFGANIRAGITKLLAIETGLLYTRKNYYSEFNLADSSLTAENDFGLINFDVPVNLLVYIQLGEKLYANTALGVSLTYNPSNIRTQVEPGGAHTFSIQASRRGFFSGELNANIGFEYRTEKDGFFYFGFAGKVPFEPLLKVVSIYRNDDYVLFNGAELSGATFALDFKYFFHNTRNKG
ncbi:MAG: hypothetical protein ACPGU5_07580, partial [Lishizhenia sp.]